MKEEDFCRAQRKHYDVHLQRSEQTGQAAEIPVVGRCEWQPGKPKLKERKHFKHTCKYACIGYYPSTIVSSNSSQSYGSTHIELN